ncbi:hypothetical protein SS50377_20477 [Spironucleus salmonicida]|uniref:Uncharacterized protein n=1 Tax=Spironucleus salmonicida TaxID=348837 RepID=V6LLS9_9EUKA|nr:hypothetical protein SS50377_20477 [Spironucleus salmonicida]|eukprot:EST45627.1 Hypothetical protein SS50377_14484 [Spironucleus salmonicida]
MTIAMMESTQNQMVQLHNQVVLTLATQKAKAYHFDIKLSVLRLQLRQQREARTEPPGQQHFGSAQFFSQLNLSLLAPQTTKLYSVNEVLEYAPRVRQRASFLQGLVDQNNDIVRQIQREKDRGAQLAADLDLIQERYRDQRQKIQFDGRRKFRTEHATQQQMRLSRATQELGDVRQQINCLFLMLKRGDFTFAE